MRNKTKIFFLTLLLLISFLSVCFINNYSSACESFAEYGIKGTITNEINKKIACSLTNDNEYHNFVTVNKNNDGSLSSLYIESSKINIIALEISSDIYETIIESNFKFGLPLGNAFGFRVLSGNGPKLKLKIMPLGATEYEIKSEFVSGGINQTLHRIKLLFTTEIVCLAPFNEKAKVIETELILAESVIIGKIPEVVVQR